MFTAHTIIQQKGYFGTKGHPPFDVRCVTRDSDTHVRPDVQGAAEDVPRETGGGVLGEPWTHGHSREPAAWGPQSVEQGTGPETSVSLPSCHLQMPQAQDTVRVLLEQTEAEAPSAPQPRVSQPGDRGDSQGTHAWNRRKLPMCPRSNASWCLIPISEDMMNQWCGGIPTEQKAGDKPLRVDGPAGTLKQGLALEAGRVGWRTPGPTAQPHVQTEGSPATLHGLSSGPTPPAVGVGPSAGAWPVAPGEIPHHPCVPLGKPNPPGLWAFRRHPPGGGMPAELGLSLNSGDPPPSKAGPPSLSY